MTEPQVDASDFAGIYDRFFPKVYNYVRYRVGDAEAADDVVSRIFEKALDRLGSYDPDRAPFDAWLFAIARNAVVDHFRGRRLGQMSLEEGMEPAGLEPPAQDALELEEFRHELLDALRRLDDRERELLALKFGAGMKSRDIAAHTGLGESHVGVILFRAVKKLQVGLKVEP